MLLISVVQFFDLLFGCPMTNFRSLLRKTPDSPNFEAPPLTPPPPPPPPKKEWSPMFSTPVRKHNDSDFFFRERQICYTYVIY